MGGRSFRPPVPLACGDGLNKTALRYAGNYLTLTLGAVERSALGLDDADDFAVATARTGGTGSVVDLVLVLVAAFFVDRIAVGAIAQRRNLHSESLR